MADLQIQPCSDSTEHICTNGGDGATLHHSPLAAPFSDGTTEHAVGECDACAEWDAGDRR